MKLHPILQSPLLVFIYLLLFFFLAPLAAQTLNVPIPGKRSILRVGALPDQVTDRGREIAQLIMDGLEKNDGSHLARARSKLEPLLGKENLGGGYSALYWILNVVLTPDNSKKPSFLNNPLDQHYVDFFFANNYAHLKEYLKRKFGVNDFRPDNREQHMTRTQLLEDMIIFNNPARSSWDSIEDVVDIVRKLGPHNKRIVDVGAGFGFFSYRLAQLAGDDGIVYAIDTSEPYIDQLREMVKTFPLGNIVPIVSADDDIKVTEESDLFFISSLYHVLYSWSPHDKRDAFFRSLKKSLRPGGYVVILDNRFNSGLELHNSYINKDFVVAQLYYYGLELLEHQRLSDTRFALVFRNSVSEKIDMPTFSREKGGRTLSISSSRSAVHIGSLDSFDITPPGTEAAEYLYQAIDESNAEAAQSAIAIYDIIIPKENFGGEYTALRWIARHLTIPQETRDAMTKDPLHAEFLAYLSANNFERLKFFLSRKYKLGKEELSVEEAIDEETRKIGIVNRQSLEDFILFNNPERESWEKSSLIVEQTPIRAGDTVVDIGSGPGYFSFKFADIVGEGGRVFALDTKKPHIDYMEGLIDKWGTKNLFPSVSSTDGLGLEIKGEADLVFMCSLYHILYAVSSVDEREGMLAGIQEVLKPGGKLVIVDNGPVEDQDLPYHGPYIRKELIVAQLAEYGFVLERSHQIIPQRYMLVFTKG